MKMINTYYLCQWILFFFIYSFIGWIWECCYVSVKQHRWVNRGFLQGPILPLYGSGALIILIGTIPVREHAALIFVFGMIGATILEYATGAVMERLFHVKYWDYSGQPGNIRGYICPRSSLCWGFFSILMVRVIHLPVESAVLKLPLTVCEGIAAVLLVAASVDFTQSFNEAMDMKNILVQLEESRKKIRKIRKKLKMTREETIADYRRYYAKVREKNLTRRNAFIEQVHAKREWNKRQLMELADRVELLLKEEIPAKAALISGHRREELSVLKDDILQELQKLGARTDKRYLHAARHLKRNPGAVSARFQEALEELRHLMNAEQQKKDRKRQNEGEDK